MVGFPKAQTGSCRVYKLDTVGICKLDMVGFTNWNRSVLRLLSASAKSRCGLRTALSRSVTPGVVAGKSGQRRWRITIPGHLNAEDAAAHTVCRRRHSSGGEFTDFPPVTAGLLNRPAVKNASATFLVSRTEDFPTSCQARPAPGSGTSAA